MRMREQKKTTVVNVCVKNLSCLVRASPLFNQGIVTCLCFLAGTTGLTDIERSMATRNLTKAFISARNGGKANRSILKSERLESISGDSDGAGSDSGLLNSVGDTVNWKAVRESLPPIWVEKLENVEEDVEKIQNKIKGMFECAGSRLIYYPCPVESRIIPICSFAHLLFMCDAYFCALSRTNLFIFILL